jgi:aminoglycoside phosphotransferase (APT) family kinase protein
MSTASTTAAKAAGNYKYLEPRLAHIFQRKDKLQNEGPYVPKTSAEVAASLKHFLSNTGFSNVSIDKVKRMAGGASKEQFLFELNHDGLAAPERFVLRMDPNESIVETCRWREAQIIEAMSGVVPVPPLLAVDAEGDYLGRPGLITGFVGGVTKPTDMEGTAVSGIGSSFGEYAAKLTPQFVDYLCKIHAYSDWGNYDLSTFVIPKAGTREAALTQVDCWSKIWHTDKVEPIPLITLAEQWLRDNAPVCDAPCVVHCDYRLGNFLFEEPSGKITTVLDWELAHFGDFHEDMAWILQRLFGSWSESGEFLVCGLMPRDEFLAQYQQQSGRIIDPEKLRFYELLNAWKCAVMDLSTAVRAGKNSNNHQDILITWLASAGAVFLNRIVALMRGV